MLSLIIVILMLGFMFKVCFWMIGLAGRIIGSLIGFIFYVIIGVISLTVLGLGMVILPVIIVAGIGGIVYAIAKS